MRLAGAPNTVTLEASPAPGGVGHEFRMTPSNKSSYHVPGTACVTLLTLTAQKRTHRSPSECISTSPYLPPGTTKQSPRLGGVGGASQGDFSSLALFAGEAALACPRRDSSATALCSLVGWVRLIGDVCAFPRALASFLYVKKNYCVFSRQNFPPSALPWQNVS